MYELSCWEKLVVKYKKITDSRKEQMILVLFYGKMQESGVIELFLRYVSNLEASISKARNASCFSAS